MGMKCAGRSAFRLGGFLLGVALVLLVVACNGGGAGREPAGDVTEGPTDAGTPAATATPTVSPEAGGGTRLPAFPTASPWPPPEPRDSDTHDAGEAASPLPTVSLEELSAIGGDPPPGDGEIDPCSLVTKAEAERIIEQQVVDVWRHAHFFRVCEYFSDVDAEPFGSAVIRVERGLSEDEFEEEIEEIESGEMGVPKAKAVSGIGDAAYSVGPLLWVYQESTMLVITVVVKERPELDAAKEVAQIALRRLP